MSVNNLTEHLSWLLDSKIFIPPNRNYGSTTVKDRAALKPDGEASRIWFSTSALQHEPPKKVNTESSSVMEENGPYKLSNISNESSVYTSPSFKRKRDIKSPNVREGGPYQQEAHDVASKLQQGHHNTEGYIGTCEEAQSMPKSTSKSPASISAKRPDMLDLTMIDGSDIESAGRSESSNAPGGDLRADSAVVAGKKRKSGEYESDLRGSGVPLNSKRQLSWGHGFDIIDDETEDPPPPYSTAPSAFPDSNVEQQGLPFDDSSKSRKQKMSSNLSASKSEDCTIINPKVSQSLQRSELQRSESALGQINAEQRGDEYFSSSQRRACGILNEAYVEATHDTSTARRLEDSEITKSDPERANSFVNPAHKFQHDNTTVRKTQEFAVPATDRYCQSLSTPGVNRFSQASSSLNRTPYEQGDESGISKGPTLERQFLDKLLRDWPLPMLEKHLQEVTAKFDQSLDEFVIATSEDSADTASLKMTLDNNRVEKNATEQLIKEMQIYETQKKRHAILAGDFREAVRQEIEERSQDIAAELKTATKILRQQEVQLFRLIEDANLTVDEEKSKPESTLVDSHHSTVPSTPAFHRDPLTAQAACKEWESSATRPVKRAQFPVWAVADGADQPSIALQNKTAKSSRADTVADRWSPAQELEHPPDCSGELETTRSTSNMLWKSVESDNEISDDVNENIFSTIMGTPPEQLCVDENEFELHDDDDIFEIASELFHSSPKRRDVFAETSGNSMIAPLSKQSLKQSPNFRSTSSSVLTHKGLQHPWSAEVKDVMLNTFHLSGFRSNQLEAINATLAAEHVFVLMPTGGGKSLCYQLPAVIRSGKTQGVTMVVSPLLSLMEDQISHLHKLGIKAALLNGEISVAEKNEVMSCLRNPHSDPQLQILYVTPEMVTKNQGLLSALRNLHFHTKLARFVIDEAHCVSQWGHDFRPDYKTLGEILREFEGIPIIALTATATETVKADVMHNLNIEGCSVLSQSFNRPNLTYEVLPKKSQQDVFDAIVKIINNRYTNKSGIIYCLSRKKCEDLADQLRGVKIKAHHYHAQMSSHEKKDVQQKWQAGEIHVIVATIAFGMGIDKPDVRFVIHHSIPKSLEGYYQETGRAGRDGMRSGCYLFYGFQDFNILRGMIDKGDGSKEQKDRQIYMLRSVVQFCENKSDCRRAQVLAYFNEAFHKEDCNGGCDNCNSTSKFEDRDLTDYAIAALRIVKQLWRSKVTMLHCVDVFRGAKTKKLIDKEHHTLAEYGSGADLNRNDAERIFNRLISEGALVQHNVTRNKFTHTYVKPGKSYRSFAAGSKRVNLQVRVSPARPARPARQLNETQQQRPRRKQADLTREPIGVPLSTNISSPIRKQDSRSLSRFQYEPDKSRGACKRSIRQNDETHHPNLRQSDTESIDDEAFEPVRPARLYERRRGQPLGPPITTDEKMSNLNEIHRHCVDDFVGRAKALCQKILVERGLRQVPFTDTMLREMAIGFPCTREELLAIPGIDPEKVELYGKGFLDLIKTTRENYNSIIQSSDDRPMDPNHQTVVDLISDDDMGEEDLDEKIEDDHDSTFEASEGEESSYFTRKDRHGTQNHNRRAEPPLRRISNGSAPRLGTIAQAHRESSGAARRKSWTNNSRGTSKRWRANGTRNNTTAARVRGPRVKKTGCEDSCSSLTTRPAAARSSRTLSKAAEGIGIMPT